MPAKKLNCNGKFKRYAGRKSESILRTSFQDYADACGRGAAPCKERYYKVGSCWCADKLGGEIRQKDK